MLKTILRKKQIFSLLLIGTLISFVFSCSVTRGNQESVLLRVSPEVGSEYEISTNMNIALDMKQPININMEFFIRTKFDSILPNGDFSKKIQFQE